MTATPDPAAITPPTDPAAYGRPRRRGPAFWAIVALCAVVAVGSFLVARYGLQGWTLKTPAFIAPAAETSPAEPAEPSPARPAGETPAPAGEPAATSAEIAALQARVEALESGQARTVNAAAAALAAASLAEATQGSGPFEVELAALERVLPLSNEVRALRPYAEDGAPSRAALAAEFDTAAARAAVASRDPGERAGFLARVGHALSAIVTIRRVSTTGASPDAVLTRAETALSEGDVDGALKILRELPPKGAQAMGGWRARAQRRAAVDRLVASVRAQALSDLMAVSRERP